MQLGQPFVFEFTLVTKTQKQYAQNEKELLTVVYGLEHLYYDIYGRNVKIQKDHSLLFGLSQNQQISSRLQRWLLRLNKYNTDLQHVKGSNSLQEMNFQKHSSAASQQLMSLIMSGIKF